MLNPAQVLSSNLTPFFWLLILVVLIFLAVRYYTLLSRRQADRASDLNPGITLTQRPILTAAETKFFRALQAAVGKQYAIFPQLPLWTLIQPEANDPNAARAFNNRINLKRLDFVLVDSTSLMPYLAIELGDRSHQQEADRSVTPLLTTSLRKPESKSFTLGLLLPMTFKQFVLNLALISSKTYQPSHFQNQIRNPTSYG